LFSCLPSKRLVKQSYKSRHDPSDRAYEGRGPRPTCQYVPGVQRLRFVA
jgi:hypothetical protein